MLRADKGKNAPESPAISSGRHFFVRISICTILNGGTVIAIATAKCVMKNGFERKTNNSEIEQHLSEVATDTFSGAGMEARKKVLIAEDYEDIRHMTRIMIELIGFDVIEAANGYEAVEQAKRNKPDVVLMDIAMPKLNGITAASMIHQLDGCRDVPIIAITAFGRDYVKEAGAYGFDAVIEKPVDMDELRLAIEAQIGNAPASAASH